MRADELYELTNYFLNSNQTVKGRVGGYSMYPLLRNGFEIIVNKCSINDIIPGDIVVFKRGPKLVAHRALKKNIYNNKTILTTKGDSCRNTDEPITEENFCGKVIFFIKKGKEKKTNTIYNQYAVKYSNLLTFYCYSLVWIISRYNKINQTIKSIFKSIFFVCRESKKLAITNTIIAILQGILPFAIIYLFKWLIDLIWKINSNADKTILYNNILTIVIITGIVFLFSSILSIFSSILRERLSQSVSLYIYNLLHRKHITLDMAYLEDSEQQDKIHRAVNEAGFRPLKMINESFTAIQSILSWLVIAILLFKIHWLIFVLILFAVIPEIFIRFYFSKKFYNLNKSNSTREREAYYYNRILTGLAFAKELRLFGTGSFFKERFNNIQTYLHKKKNSLIKKRAIAEIAAQIFAVTIIFISFGYISFLAINGIVSAGTVVLFFLIFQRGYAVLKDFFNSLAGLYEDNVFLGDFFSFLELPALSKSSSKEKINTLQKSIVIDNVSFHYPSSQRKALDTVSLEIPAGKTVALVGPNGSGKTTLVKLLCGFYFPDNGKIFFDNNDISCINPDDLRKNITAVFQDFALYNMTAGENIFLGNISEPASIEKIKESAKNAGIDDVLEQLPQGYNNIIGNLFEKGEELSIGQWQKMAIARAFYRNSPILFMDEPSSALDAETELQLLKNLKSLAKDKTVLIISHRFSTIQWADMIYVLENGKVVEQGNHEQLMLKQGKYYKMFENSRAF
ncbi:MAG TPA: signal peptidase I [Bacteroidales bacterium]|nr:signal peptidase I [Bacteroidales bacterium]HPS18024.1 signal peptidase I [Bacteroidales bacterium]